METIRKNFRNLLVLIVLLLFGINSSAQNYAIKITSPSEGSQVSGSTLISGTATLPPSGYLWILAHKVGFNGFWPQGNGAAQVIGGSWDVLVQFGQKGEYGKFEVIALIVNAQTHQDLENWVRNAPNTTPSYQPIPLPTTIDGSPIVRLRVDKTKD